jgi:hypothetical protein
MSILTLRGPDIAVVGWIPFYPSLKHLPPTHKYRESLATHMLFNSGNNEPPAEFGSYDDFNAWLDADKDYRGALYIRDITLRYENGLPAPSILYKANGRMGYTPLKLVIAGVELAPPNKYRYRKGKSPSDFPLPQDIPLPDNVGSSIIFRYQFKLSPLMDLIQRSITGQWAPNAWVSIEYQIYRTRVVRVLIRGSAIPSQHIYVNWRRVDHRKHDMMDNAEEEINGFMVETPGCKDAPSWVIQQFNETADSGIINM